MGAPSKRARKVRQASEFDLARLKAALPAPRQLGATFAWSLADIVAARNMQMLGSFRLPARLAESMRTDDALYVAFENRLAPQRCIKTVLKPRGGARGASVASEASALFGQEGIGISPETLADIHGCLVNHGVAFGVCDVTPRADGSRVDYALRAWPIEHVRWDAYEKTFKTIVDLGPEETITHGDGRWVVFQKNELEPFKHGALLPGAIVWARHAFAARDWAKGSSSHGNAKVVGEMPAGVALQVDGGELTGEAAAFLALLQSMASDEVPVGIRPAGSKTEVVSNTSSAWQVWKELVMNAETAAARIYLGTDGTLGSRGGAPGVDVEAMFGVAATLVEGDLRCIERAILTGVIEPWAAVNFGDSSLAPSRLYLIPDADADAQRASVATRRQAFYADIAAARANGFAITQGFVERVAASHGVDAPELSPDATKAP